MFTEERSLGQETRESRSTPFKSGDWGKVNWRTPFRTWRLGKSKLKNGLWKWILGNNEEYPLGVETGRKVNWSGDWTKG